MARMMKLGLSMRRVGYHIAAWRHPDVQADGQEDLTFFLASARAAERATFDFVFLADGLAVRAEDVPPGSLAVSNENVELEPLTLLAALAPLTSRIGLIATASTTYDAPYHIARRYASLDHISGGRAGWNIVTSWSDQEALNFSRETQLDHAARYARAREFLDVVTGLWDSWESDAFVRDKARGQFYDPAKLHVLDHKGPHFQVRGPLTASRTPQGRPVLAHAGASAAGQEIAASLADLVYTNEYQIEASQAFRRDLHERAIARGREADDVKVMVGVQPIVGRTRAEAQAKLDLLQGLVPELLGLAAVYNILGDLSAYDLDRPIPDDFVLQGKTSNADKTLDLARREGLTIRELSLRVAGKAGIRQVVGTPTEVADDLQAWFESGACDGFNICPAIAPSGIEDFAELVVPELRSRGLFRTEYEGRTLRENLGLRPAPNRHERAQT